MSKLMSFVAFTGLALSLSTPASACRVAVMQDLAPPNLIIVGEAVELVNIEYMDDLPQGYDGDPVPVSSTVTFKVISVLNGDYAHGTINAKFKSAWASPVPVDLAELREGGDHQSLIGLYLSGPNTPQEAHVWSDICSPNYFVLKPADDAPQRDQDNWTRSLENAALQK